MVPVTAITMMNAVIASPVQRWSHKILFRNMSCLSGMVCRLILMKHAGKSPVDLQLLQLLGARERKAKPTRRPEVLDIVLGQIKS